MEFIIPFWCETLVNTPRKHNVDPMLVWSNVGPPSATLAQHKTSTGSTPRVCWDAFSPVNTKHFYNICTMLDQRRRRWADVVQMLYKCFEFAGNSSWSVVYCWWRLQADPYPMSVKCWASVAGAGQYPFSPSQYFMLPVPACWRYGHMLWTKAGSMLARGLWRWPTFSVAPNTVTQYWANVSSAA